MVGQLSRVQPLLLRRGFPEDRQGFFLVEVAGVHVYSCYFSPCDPFTVFESDFVATEESLHEVGVLIAFLAKCFGKDSTIILCA